MAAVEKKAIEKGYTSLILETSRLHKEAIHLYQNRGYAIIKKFGQYQGLNKSICMKKELVEDKIIHKALHQKNMAQCLLLCSANIIFA